MRVARTSDPRRRGRRAEPYPGPRGGVRPPRWESEAEVDETPGASEDFNPHMWWKVDPVFYSQSERESAGASTLT